MGSKGSSAPPPDPRLVEAQMRSMGIQEDAIKRMVANAESFMPLQKEQMQFGLDSAKAAYGQSQQDREWMLTRRSMLSGTQDKLVSEANSFNTEAKGNELAGQAQADVNAGFASARGQSARSLARMGVAPGSGKALAMDSALQIGQATALAGGANMARRGARDEGRALTDRANNALAGYPSMSMGATGAGAGYGASGITIANTGLGGMNSGFGSAAQVAGQLGTNATGMFGQQAQREAGMQEQSSMGGIGAIMGGAAQMYGSGMFKGSDRRLKQSIERVGVDAATGLNIYEFAYIADPSRRFRGVMADEALAVNPEAVVVGADGMMAVNYALLGIPFTEVAP